MVAAQKPDLSYLLGHFGEILEVMFMPPWQIFCWPFKVTSTVLCIVDEAGLGTALIVGCMSS